MLRSLLLTAFAASAAGASAQKFTALPTDIAIGYFPAMEMEDLNGDGKLDLLICGGQTTGASTQLLFGDGRGGFVRQSNAPFVDVQDGNLALADIDGDGDVDVLITGDRGQNIGQDRWRTRLYRNDGRGGFTEVEQQPFRDLGDGAVAFSDVDGDGDQDALVAGYAPSDNYRGASVYLNDGRGTFTEVTPSVFKQPAYPTLAFSDLDGDRDADLIIGGTTWPQAAQVYRNDGGGRFTTYPQVGYSGVSYSAVALGDVDGDGDVDALFSGRDGVSDDKLSRMFFNDGAADFTPAFPQPFHNAHLGGIALTDVDLDGDLDAVFTGQTDMPSGSQPATLLYLNDGKGNFTEATVQPFAALYLSAIIARDIDGDGVEDIILAGSTIADGYKTIIYRNEASLVGVRDARTATSMLRVWPNPVSVGAEIKIAYEGAAVQTVDVEITDAIGRRGLTQKLLTVAGLQTLSLPSTGLSAGLYGVSIEGHSVEVLVID